MTLQHIMHYGGSNKRKQLAVYFLLGTFEAELQSLHCDLHFHQAAFKWVYWARFKSTYFRLSPARVPWRAGTQTPALLHRIQQYKHKEFAWSTVAEKNTLQTIPLTLGALLEDSLRTSPGIKTALGGLPVSLPCGLCCLQTVKCQNVKSFCWWKTTPFVDQMSPAIYFCYWATGTL